MSIDNGQYVQAGLRFLRMDEAGQKEAREQTRPDVFERVEAEAAAVQWVEAAAHIWNEQGVLDDVLEYVRSKCQTEQTSLEVAV